MFQIRDVCFKVDLCFNTWLIIISHADGSNPMGPIFVAVQRPAQAALLGVFLTLTWNSFCCHAVCSSCRYSMWCCWFTWGQSAPSRQQHDFQEKLALYLLSQSLWLVQLLQKLVKLTNSVSVNPATLWSTFTFTQPIYTLCCCTYIH